MLTIPIAHTQSFAEAKPFFFSYTPSLTYLYCHTHPLALSKDSQTLSPTHTLSLTHVHTFSRTHTVTHDSRTSSSSDFQHDCRRSLLLSHSNERKTVLPEFQTAQRFPLIFSFSSYGRLIDSHRRKQS